MEKINVEAMYGTVYVQPYSVIELIPPEPLKWHEEIRLWLRSGTYDLMLAIEFALWYTLMMLPFYILASLH